VKHSKSIIGKKILFEVMVILFVVLERQIAKQSENILRNRVEKYLKKLLDFKTDMSIIGSKRRNTMSICCNTYDEHKFEPRYDEEEKIDQVALDKGIKFWKENRTAFQVDSKLKSKIYLFDICTRCGTKILK